MLYEGIAVWCLDRVFFFFVLAVQASWNIWYSNGWKKKEEEKNSIYFYLLGLYINEVLFSFSFLTPISRTKFVTNA